MIERLIDSGNTSGMANAPWSKASAPSEQASAVVSLWFYSVQARPTLHGTCLPPLSSFAVISSHLRTTIGPRSRKNGEIYQGLDIWAYTQRKPLYF